MKKPKSQDIFRMTDGPMSLVRRTICMGTGMDIEELSEKPMIAVANSLTDINPGHNHLRTIADRVKEGVHAAGGIPFEFNVPAPCDGLTEGNEGMRYVLAQRDLIADMIETHVRSMRFDALVMIASCDKIIPGMIMAAARLNLPSIFLTGGPNVVQMRFDPKMKGIGHEAYDDIFDKLKVITCASSGSCEVMGTANTFQSLTEALGLSLPGSASVPAFHAEKLRFARKVGMRIVSMIEEDFSVDKVLTQKSIENAVMVDLAIGGSTNAALHIPAIAHQLGIDLSLDIFNNFSEKIPTLCGISPNGPYGLQDLFIAGGIPAVMKMLADDLHLDALNVCGKTLKDIVDETTVLDSEVIHDKREPYLPEGGTVALYGNLAPDGAVVKQSAVAQDMRVFRGRARVFESEADCIAAINANDITEGEVLIIRNEGPKGGPGMPEMLAATMALSLTGKNRVALITDGRFSGGTQGPCIGHVSPEAYDGGPIAAVQDGDEITIDIPGRRVYVKLTEKEIKNRLKAWKPYEREIPTGFMQRYVKYVSSAARGAVIE
ncbi:MAG: dihydroxy-acid dehydratase [Deltaproteobacteria bacterium]|nr:dihydroxy-acid dehydratase [Deltaproteobacteria bacterium]